MDELSVAMGENIRRIRKANGMSLKRVAEEIGATPEQMCRWEQGFCCPSAFYLIRISKAFGCYIEELYEGVT